MDLLLIEIVDEERGKHEVTEQHVITHESHTFSV